MSTLTHTTPAPAPALGHRLGALAVGLRDLLRREAIRRRTYRELASLTDHELQDLGIFRCDIAAVARSAARNV